MVASSGKTASEKSRKKARPGTKPPVFSMPLRFVLWQEEGRWWAQCLEINALGDGTTMSAAIRQLCKAIATTIDFCIHHDMEDSIIQPADQEAWNMFFRGENIAEAEMMISIRRLDPYPLQIRRSAKAPSHA